MCGGMFAIENLKNLHHDRKRERGDIYIPENISPLCRWNNELKFHMDWWTLTVLMKAMQVNLVLKNCAMQIR